MIRYTQVVNEPTHMSESQTDHVCIKSALIEEFQTKTIVQKHTFLTMMLFSRKMRLISLSVNNNWCQMLLVKH